MQATIADRTNQQNQHEYEKSKSNWSRDYVNPSLGGERQKAQKFLSFLSLLLWQTGGVF